MGNFNLIPKITFFYDCVVVVINNDLIVTWG